MNTHSLTEDICNAIKRSHFSIEEIAHRARIANATIYLWFSGVTRSPKIDTLEKVAAAIGMKIVLVEDRLAIAPIDRVPPPADVKRVPRMGLWMRMH